MVPIEEVLEWALAQDGDRYIFGAEASPADADPEAFDCSELVQWSCARAKVIPVVPDGAYNQWVHTRERSISVPEGIDTRGALLFVGDGRGVGRDAITHVAWSLGDGTTIEARGSKWGVGVFSAYGRFNFAARIPGCDYAQPPLIIPLDEEEEDMWIIIRAKDRNPTLIIGDEAISGIGDADRHLLEKAPPLVRSRIISQALHDKITKKLNATE